MDPAQRLARVSTLLDEARELLEDGPRHPSTVAACARVIEAQRVLLDGTPLRPEAN